MDLVLTEKVKGPAQRSLDGAPLEVGTGATSGPLVDQLFLEFLEKWFVDFVGLHWLKPELKLPEHLDELFPIN